MLGTRATGTRATEDADPAPACVPGSYAIDPLDQGEQDQEHHDPENYGDDIHELTMGEQSSQLCDDLRHGHNNFVTNV